MRQGLAVVAALALASFVATPLVISASKALATPGGADTITMPAAVTPVEVAPVPAPVVAESCSRKVRVVYAGYASPGCATLR